MFGFFLKLEELLKSEKYRYFDIFLGCCVILYCLYSFLVNNVIEYWFLVFGFIGLLLGLFDVTRKLTIKIQRSMLGLKK
jgi:hypothetical protein